MMHVSVETMQVASLKIIDLKVRCVPAALMLPCPCCALNKPMDFSFGLDGRLVLNPADISAQLTLFIVIQAFIFQ